MCEGIPYDMRDRAENHREGRKHERLDRKATLGGRHAVAPRAGQ